MRSRGVLAGVSVIGAATFLLLAFGGFQAIGGLPSAARATPSALSIPSASLLSGTPTPRAQALLQSALEQVGVTTSYRSGYVHLDYPGGDVPAETGMCADVIVRAFRGIGVDLQREIHEEMTAHPEAYPQPWGQARPDRNIDHRQVHNLASYLSRRGMKLPVSPLGREYVPGDIVTWEMAGYPHIGIVSDTPVLSGTHYQVVHNIGRGVRVEDTLFLLHITGHYGWR